MLKISWRCITVIRVGVLVFHGEWMTLMRMIIFQCVNNVNKMHNGWGIKHLSVVKCWQIQINGVMRAIRSWLSESHVSSLLNIPFVMEKDSLDCNWGTNNLHFVPSWSLSQNCLGIHNLCCKRHHNITLPKGTKAQRMTTELHKSGKGKKGN